MRKTKTYEEVTGALARCGTSEYKSCDQCPYSNNKMTCVERMTKDALDLINRQQADIKKWKTECGIFTLEREMYKGGSIEAVKMFAERLKNHRVGNVLVMNIACIDYLVKEMVGDSK